MIVLLVQDKAYAAIPIDILSMPTIGSAAVVASGASVVGATVVGVTVVGAAVVGASVDCGQGFSEDGQINQVPSAHQLGASDPELCFFILYNICGCRRSPL